MPEPAIEPPFVCTCGHRREAHHRAPGRFGFCIERHCPCLGFTWRRSDDGATDPPFIPRAEYIEPTTIDEARQQMCAELHRALYGDVWARPQSARDVWVDMLERIDRASRALRR